MKKRSGLSAVVPAAMTALVMTMSLSACGGGSPASELAEESGVETKVETKVESQEPSDMPDVDADIDLDALNKSIENIKNLDLGADAATDTAAAETGETADAAGASDTYAAADTAEAPAAQEPAGSISDKPAGEVTKYSYADVTIDGTDITIVPNGGLNGSTVLYGDKDLSGFLDYIDSVVLEEGRVIDRDLFYNLLTCMLVDKDLSSDFAVVEKNLMMTLAVANNFHDQGVKLHDCYLDANNPVEYRYHVNIYGKDDTWVVNYSDCTFFMNDGKTEYVTEMFKNEYLAVWLMSIEEYYGVEIR